MRLFFSLKRRLWRFSRDRRGTSTVEFLLVAPIFLMSFLWVFEIGFIMTQSMMLERALDLTVRDMRISDDVTFTQENITRTICERATIFSDCETSLVLEMTPIASAADIPDTSTTCADRAAVVNPVTTFNRGARGDTIFLRACIVVDPMFGASGLGVDFTTDATGGLRLIAKSAFLNEPA